MSLFTTAPIFAVIWIIYRAFRAYKVFDFFFPKGVPDDPFVPQKRTRLKTTLKSYYLFTALAVFMMILLLIGSQL